MVGAGFFTTYTSGSTYTIVVGAGFLTRYTSGRCWVLHVLTTYTICIVVGAGFLTTYNILLARFLATYTL